MKLRLTQWRRERLMGYDVKLYASLTCTMFFSSIALGIFAMVWFDNEAGLFLGIIGFLIAIKPMSALHASSVARRARALELDQRADQLPWEL